MQELCGSTFDCRAEREHLKAAVANELKLRSAFEQRKQAISKRRAELEAKLLAAEEVLEAAKQEALDAQEEAASGRREQGDKSSGLRSLGLAIEEASAAVQRLDGEIAAVQDKSIEIREDRKEQLEASGCIYRLAVAATGVHFDADAQGRQGYVAVAGRARHFDVAAGLDQVAAAEAVWKELEACLPEPLALECPTERAEL